MYVILAGPVGFEPAIEGSEPSALPLGYGPKKMAGISGFEPELTVLETAVLPLTPYP